LEEEEEEEGEGGEQQGFPAAVEMDREVSSEEGAWFLTPSKGNIHKFEARSRSCVIFDILLPPYREPDRPCRYYSLRDRGGGEEQVWLRQLSAEEERIKLGRGVLPLEIRYRGYVPSLPQFPSLRDKDREKNEHS
jgi:hypothetical protein